MLFLDAISTSERIRISGALSSKITELRTDLAPLARLLVARQVAELLRHLVGADEAKVARLVFSLSDKESSAKALDDYLENGLADLPASLAPFEVEAVRDLAISAGSEDVAEGAKQMRRLQIMRAPGGQDGAHLAAYEEIAARGVRTGLDSVAVMRKAAEADELMRQSAKASPEFAKATAAIAQLNDQFRADEAEFAAKQKAEREAISAGKTDRTVLGELQVRRLASYEQYKKDYDALRAEVGKASAAFKAEKAKAALEMFEQEGEAVLLAIRAASPVSEREATEWAARQVVDGKALAKLARLGYKKADLYRDMAEFYRLTGGKSSAIRISSDGGRRANAVGVETRLDEKVINLGSRFDKTVLFHELAHFLENDPIAKAASNGFLVKRRESPTVFSLKSLTGQSYRSNEGAYKDNFMDPYIGKVYGDGVTEVFAMGMQYLANPKDAAIFAAKDPEMFALISGYLSGELTPAMHAKLNMHAGAIDTLQGARQDESERYEKAVASLARRVTLARDEWWREQQAAGSFEAQQLEHYAFTRNKPPQYIGSYGDYRVFEGVFRNKNTSRNAKGHLVARSSPASTSTEYAPIHGGLDLAKSFIVLAEEQGLRLTAVWYNVFYEKAGKDPKKAIISSAQSIMGALK